MDISKHRATQVPWLKSVGVQNKIKKKKNVKKDLYGEVDINRSQGNE